MRSKKLVKNIKKTQKTGQEYWELKNLTQNIENQKTGQEYWELKNLPQNIETQKTGQEYSELKNLPQNIKNTKNLAQNIETQKMVLAIAYWNPKSQKTSYHSLEAFQHV